MSLFIETFVIFEMYSLALDYLIVAGISLCAIPNFNNYCSKKYAVIYEFVRLKNA